MKRLLIQAGHVEPREPGFEAGTGTVREQELALAVQARLAKILTWDGRFDVTLCPGDVPDGWTGDVFLSLHGDGSSNPARSGYCYGYPPTSTASADFAKKLAYEYEKIGGHPSHGDDNYTTALRGYYGFKRVTAPVKVLVEHGFLTNPTEQAWLFGNVDAICRAHYAAILKHFALPRIPTYDVWVNGALWLLNQKAESFLVRLPTKLAQLDVANVRIVKR